MNDLKVVCVIQARLGNSRLPNKVLKDIKGFTMLERVQMQVLKSKMIDDIIIAAADVELNDYKLNGVYFFCDTSIDENDVLKRTYEASMCRGADIVVRVTSDCPLVNPELIDLMIAVAIKEDLPYLSIEGLEGVFGEVFGFNQLKIANRCAVIKHEREHVTPYIKAMSKEMENKRMYLDGYKLSIDTGDDLEKVIKLVDIIDN